MKTSLLALLAASVALTTPASGYAQEHFKQGPKESSQELTEWTYVKPQPMGPFQIGGLVGVLALAAAAASGGSGSADPAPPKAPPKEPEPPLPGGSMWLLNRSHLNHDKIINAIQNGRQASQADIDAIKGQADLKWNRAIDNSKLWNKLALGLTGKGVDVVVVDTGVDFDNVNLDDVQRGDVIRLQGGIQFIDAENNGLRHGTGVAQVIAGDVGDDNHARGIAPGVTLHDITAIHESGSKATNLYSNTRLEMFNSISRGGYDIANMSFSLKNEHALVNLKAEGERFFTQAYRNAIKGAFDKGTILVISTGNDGLASTNNLYASLGFMDDMTKGQLITVAALDERGTALAGYSNACGQAKLFCISATGNFYPVMRDGGNGGSFSGTSSAAPVVSASLALLKEQFPELTSGELVELVFATADDLGDEGIDDVFGRGALNMNRAMVPVGELRYINGATTASSSIAAGHAGFEANTATNALKFALKDDQVTLVDDFNRGFDVSASTLVIDNPERIQPIAKFKTTINLADGSQVIVAGDDGAAFKQRGGLQLGFITPDAMVSHGELFDRGYHALSILDRAYVAGYDFGKWDVGFAKSEDKDTASIWAGLDLGSVNLSFGAIQENKALLGAEMGSGETNSVFGSLTWSHNVSDGLSFFASANAVGSRYKTGSGMIESAEIFSASAQVGTSFDTAIIPGRTTLAIGTPLAASAGTLDVNLPVGRAAAEGNQTSNAVLRDISSRNVNRSAPIDLGISHEFGLGQGLLKISAMTEVGGTNWASKDAYVGVSYSLKF